MTTSAGVSLPPKSPDPIDDVPSPDAIRVVICEYVRRVEVLRHLLRVALRRERLGLTAPTLTGEEGRQ